MNILLFLLACQPAPLPELPPFAEPPPLRLDTAWTDAPPPLLSQQLEMRARLSLAPGPADGTPATSLPIYDHDQMMADAALGLPEALWPAGRREAFAARQKQYGGWIRVGAAAGSGGYSSFGQEVGYWGWMDDERSTRWAAWTGHSDWNGRTCGGRRIQGHSEWVGVGMEWHPSDDSTLSIGAQGTVNNPR
ncbi:MAG: hypothetical protein RL095_1917 [Verrucomicrobiota bacterium]|jgi:hypothetical protein